MATPAPLPGTPSLRNMRDTYVNLLLSNGQQQPASAAPHPRTPRPSWTPGQSLGAPYQEPVVHWASPVTPPLTDSDIRVAEVAAELVAAGDAEKRSKDALRLLADKLDKSERRNRDLEAAVRADDRKKREKRRVSYGDARRNIHFTPRTPRRSGGREMFEERRRSGRVERERGRDVDVVNELERLKLERDQWVKERERFSSMMSDIKRNTARLLEEREMHRRQREAHAEELNVHLQAIARLQDQLSEKKENGALRENHPFKPLPDAAMQHHPSREADDLFAPVRTGNRDREASPIPIYRRRSSTNANLDNPDRRVVFESETDNDDTASTVENGASRAVSAREEELRNELHLVLEENAKVSERNALLEVENARLTERIPALEAEYASVLSNLMEDDNSESNRNSAEGALERSCDEQHEVPEVSTLLEELEVLEGVEAAIRFDISPSEADRAQDTLTQTGLETTVLDVASAHNEHHQCLRDKLKPREPISAEGKIQVATQRLARVRTSLSLKYGWWLEAVGNDVASVGDESGDTAGLAGVDVSTQVIATETMNTKVIEKLVEESILKR